MMSEKRFELVNGIITDMQDNERMYGIFELVDKLNEQQATIQSLKEENKYLKKRIEVISDELYCKDRKLEELGVPIECCDKR